ncbi:hypothetical protein TspCOW1_20460 [Thiohalobacter sp. COW1]|nr:hypothetical protein TspCOW1_20460 [Thiohalobacter sp. COW1]
MPIALADIHRAPGGAWSVESLSRTAFAQHFVRLVGQTPMGYLTDLRMREADRLLRDPGQSVARVAEQMGYATEAAFRKAFKRVWGRRPGRAAAQPDKGCTPTAQPAPEPNSIRPMRLPLRRRSWPPRRGRWSRPAGG